jgi:hypothetical protein
MSSALPRNLEDVTPDWLSGALGARFPGTEVDSVTVEDAHSGTTGRALISLAYAGESALPKKLFVKLPPRDPSQRQFVAENGMGRREALFYERLSAEVPVRVPRCYCATSDDSGEHYIMLLENLEDSGCGFRNSSRRYSLDYVREVLAAFARLHARYWDSPHFDDELDWVQPPPFHPMGPLLVERALNQYSADMPPVFAELGRLYLDRAPEIHALWGRGVPTLVHGDVHDGNLFYDEALGEPGFLDWAIVGRTSCMRDVAYFLSGTLKPEDLAVHLRQLLEDYYEQLHFQGVGAIDKDELWEQFTWHAAYVWVAGVTTLAMGSEWQPVNYVSRTLERLNEAVADCASVQRLAAALKN